MQESTPKNRISMVRSERKLTQKEFANELNQYIATKSLDMKPVSYATISRWETGDTDPKAKTWDILAKYFNVDADYLRGLQKDIKSPESLTIDSINNFNLKSLSNDDNQKLRELLLNIADNVYSSVRSSMNEANDCIFDIEDKVDALDNKIDEIQYPDRHEGFE